MIGNEGVGDASVYLVFKKRNIDWEIDKADDELRAEDVKEEDGKKWFILQEKFALFERFYLDRKWKKALVGGKNIKKKVAKKVGRGEEEQSSTSGSVSDFLAKQLANTQVMNIETNYCRISTAAGGREHIALGKYALRNALTILSRAGDEDLNDAYLFNL